MKQLLVNSKEILEFFRIGKKANTSKGLGLKTSIVSFLYDNLTCSDRKSDVLNELYETKNSLHSKKMSK